VKERRGVEEIRRVGLCAERVFSAACRITFYVAILFVFLSSLSLYLGSFRIPSRGYDTVYTHSM